LELTPSQVCGCVEQLAEMQAHFTQTGGCHAALVVSSAGTVLAAAEDVGRHNAVDKALGRMLLDGALPARGCVLIVSSRASFEILQKACMAGVPFVICLSAPTSMAVELANEFGMTLVAFAREQSFNVYAGAQRIKG
jgi:FdhD protein